MRATILIANVISLIGLTACSPQGNGDDQTANDGNGVVSNEIAPTDDTTAAPSATPETDGSGGTAVADGIPASLRGRWGMVPADCTSTHGDAKGLLEVSDSLLTFYESRGKLSVIKEHSPGHLRATFDFEGEGMNWQREMEFDVLDGGQTLVRRDYGEGPPSDAFRYRKC